MIVMISGASHTGKTNLAQKLLEKHKYPYYSIDHLKMGLIRSGQTELTPEDNDKLTDYLWDIVREMIKTAVENNQNLIIEGCYIPFNWKKDFTDKYLQNIRYICLCLSDKYIDNHFADIKRFASCIENRPEEDFLSADSVKRDNHFFIEGCIQNGQEYFLIDENYEETVAKVSEQYDLYCSK